MKKIVFFMALLVFPMIGACAMDLRGSRTDILKSLQETFPLGIPKEEVITRLNSDFDISKDEMHFHDYGEEPLNTTIEGKEVSVYSWIEAVLGKNRAVRRLFIKTAVVSYFYFDQNDELIVIKVELHGDSL